MLHLGKGSGLPVMGKPFPFPARQLVQVLAQAKGSLPHRRLPLVVCLSSRAPVGALMLEIEIEDALGQWDQRAGVFQPQCEFGVHLVHPALRSLAIAVSKGFGPSPPGRRP